LAHFCTRRGAEDDRYPTCAHIEIPDMTEHPAPRPGLPLSRVTRDSLDALAVDGHLDAAAWRRAREIAGLAPTNGDWPRILQTLFTLGSALLLATALVFFIAYNWTEMGRFARLGLLEAAVVLCAALAWWLQPRTLAGRAATTAGIIATGALLAFIGQTYQTGADPWQLFAAWTVLALPWALAAAWAPSWAIVLATANLALGLYIGQAPEALRWLGEYEAWLAEMTLLNVAAGAVAEKWGPKDRDGVYRLLPRLAMLAALGFATAGIVGFILDKDLDALALPVVYAAVVAGMYWAYRRWRRDLLLLSAWALSLILVVATAMVRVLDKIGDPAAWMMLIAAVVVGLSAWAATWVRRIAREVTP
jgi:uncharacterized membrane protein